MEALLWEYRYVVVVAVLLLLWLIFDYKSFREKVLSLMLLAKKMAKDGMLKDGEEQVQFIVSMVYLKLPVRYRIVSEELLKKIISVLYVQAMDYLDNGSIDGSYKKDVEK